MSSLLKVLKKLEDGIQNGNNMEFKIPALWNTFGYKNLEQRQEFYQ